MKVVLFSQAIKKKEHKRTRQVGGGYPSPPEKPKAENTGIK
jgi:hypothetical protein